MRLAPSLALLAATVVAAVAWFTRASTQDATATTSEHVDERDNAPAPEFESLDDDFAPAADSTRALVSTARAPIEPSVAIAQQRSELGTVRLSGRTSEWHVQAPLRDFRVSIDAWAGPRRCPAYGAVALVLDESGAFECDITAAFDCDRCVARALEVRLDGPNGLGSRITVDVTHVPRMREQSRRVQLDVVLPMPRPRLVVGRARTSSGDTRVRIATEVRIR
jgi:hypothetical protein